ncbi:MAG TPA: tetratricopeptide repeat protein [Opitutaceae bacterium]
MRTKRKRAFVGCAVILLAAGLAYQNSFSGALVFDSDLAITDNPSIRHLWPLWSALNPPAGGSTVSGRPLANLSFAVNYALGGGNMWGYHALNLAIHVLGGLTLFGILRRTLGALPQWRTQEAAAFRSWSSDLGALGAAVIWTVHPLQTESVTYLAQRSESLMGLFYLLTLYSFIRSLDSARSGLWLALSIAACLMGMATKEVMVTAPLVILLFDRAFIAGSCREAWRRRRTYYLGLGATWILLAVLMAAAGSRGRTVGFATDVPWQTYALTQFRAIAHYLRLSVWPHPLVIDYGLKLETPPAILLVDGAIIAVLAGATLVGLWRRTALGFAGAWFFAILAPTSSVVPVATEIIAEHRMYLPLAAVAAVVVAGLHRLLGWRAWPVLALLAAVLSWVTERRNEDYRSARALWAETVEYAPYNPGAHNNLGAALLAEGDRAGATREFTEALRLDPSLAGSLNNLGGVLLQEGRVDEAIARYEEAVRIAPGYAEAHANLGRVLARSGRLEEAVEHFNQALTLDPKRADAHIGLGTALLRLGRLGQAIDEYRKAVALGPKFAEAHHDLGFALAKAGRSDEAIAELETAVRLSPDYAEAQENLGNALLNAHRPAEAAPHYEAVLRIIPNSVEAQVNLGNALLETGKAQEAIAAYEAALRLRPDYGIAHHDLAVALQSVGRTSEASAELEIAGRLGVGH